MVRRGERPPLPPPGSGPGGDPGDVLGRVTREVRADGTTDTLYTYDLAGRLKTVTDPKDQVTTYSYALDDAVLNTGWTNAQVATPSVSYTYETIYPRVATMVDGTGTTAYAYKAAGTLGAGQVASVDGPLTNDTITYTYDQLGRVTARAINGGANPVTWAFDALGGGPDFPQDRDVVIVHLVFGCIYSLADACRSPTPSRSRFCAPGAASRGWRPAGAASGLYATAPGRTRRCLAAPAESETRHPAYGCCVGTVVPRQEPGLPRGCTLVMRPCPRTRQWYRAGGAPDAARACRRA
jgi:YD repeat-containing protein